MKTVAPVTGNNFPDKVTPLIKGAKKTIKILVYDWRWYPNETGTSIQKFNNAIINAAQRSVDVKAIAQPDTTVKKLNDNGAKARVLGASKKLHAKMMLINSRVAIVGSHNYTKNAFEINKEISIITTDEQAIEKLNEYFHQLWR